LFGPEAKRSFAKMTWRWVKKVVRNSLRKVEFAICFFKIPRLLALKGGENALCCVTVCRLRRAAD
jgi:hypothetical protein